MQEKNKELSPQQDIYLTTEQGVRINNTDDSLKAGPRGGTLMDDFHFREKMTHFDHERIPERVVHARGSAAHGEFRVYNDSMKKYTRAKFLTDPSLVTPTFTRFSTVVGFRGSADTVRDVRGFATKFYTVEGNYDLVGNNMPVFFIQDGIKFPDLVHSIKPEPHNEMPQAAAAHDNFWDFTSLMPESMHMIMWVLSDRALPRSYSMMEGFGVHTFRLINEEGNSFFTKIHWKPVAGMASLVFDEAQKLAGKDPDFNRRDLWESIEMGNFPEFELGFQIIDEKDEFMFDFDILDATKLWPEEIVPVQKVGKLTINRNPDNFFAETEQVAFHPGNVVPGIDFTNDPLLQGRLFSYIDTQLIRLGGPNFTEIPINRPEAPVNNNNEDGYMRQRIRKGRVNYTPNSLAKGCPMHTPENMGAYMHYTEKVDGNKIRERSESFKDHYTQAKLFYNSMTPVEQKHILEAFHFELGKVETMEIRERMIDHIKEIDLDLAIGVAEGIGVRPPSKGVTKTAGEKLGNLKDKISDKVSKKSIHDAPSLSMEKNKRPWLKGKKVAALLADGFDANAFEALKEALKNEGAMLQVVAKYLGKVKGSDGKEVMVDKSHITAGSVMFDAIFIPGGKEAVNEMKKQGDVKHFINETFKHAKTIGATGEALELVEMMEVKDLTLAKGDKVKSMMGVVTTGGKDFKDFTKEFLQALAAYRHFERESGKAEIAA